VVELAACVSRHCEGSRLPTFDAGAPARSLGRTGAPRPTLSRVTTNDGRSPGSRVVARTAFPEAFGSSGYWSLLAAYSCGGSRGIALSRITAFPLNPKGEPSRPLGAVAAIPVNSPVGRRPHYPPSAAFTAALAFAKSMRPVYFAFSDATTLPMSLIEAAPVSATAAFTASATSASESCCGR
jgi:hypothetical protein